MELRFRMSEGRDRNINIRVEFNEAVGWVAFILGLCLVIIVGMLTGVFNGH